MMTQTVCLMVIAMSEGARNKAHRIANDIQNSVGQEIDTHFIMDAVEHALKEERDAALREAETEIINALVVHKKRFNQEVIENVFKRLCEKVEE